MVVATEINSSQCLNGKGFRLYTSSVVTSLGAQVIVTCPVTSLCLFNSTSRGYLYSVNLSFLFLSATNKHIAIVVEQSLETLLQCFNIFIGWHSPLLASKYSHLETDIEDLYEYTVVRCFLFFFNLNSLEIVIVWFRIMVSIVCLSPVGSWE